MTVEDITVFIKQKRYFCKMLNTHN